MKRLIETVAALGKVAEHDARLAEHDQVIGEIKERVGDIESRSEAEAIARGWLTDEEVARGRGMGVGDDGADRNRGDVGAAPLDAPGSQAGEHPSTGSPGTEGGGPAGP